MTRLDTAPEIIALAAGLGVSRGAPVDAILAFCRRRIDGWVAEAGTVTNIGALESLVTQRLQMVFEEIRSDEDFDRITEQYARAKKDLVFATMRHRFDDLRNPSYGVLVRRRNVAADAFDRFVAVIDCRGDKFARRFFTRWHEIAHRLTTHADGGEAEPGYRSEHDPIERMMDEIAAHVGFYDPIFRRAFADASEDKPLLSFGIVESIVRSSFPTASFQATLFACIKRMTMPLLYLEAALAHKKHAKRIGSGELRAVKVIRNVAAVSGEFYIPPKLRVPADSVIHRLFEADPMTDGDGEEDLGWWESQGRPLRSRAVMVQARKVPDLVIAIVQPVE